jgi:hypothetical protein
VIFHFLEEGKAKQKSEHGMFEIDFLKHLNCRHIWKTNSETHPSLYLINKQDRILEPRQL